MREFEDREGRRWKAEVAERMGTDYKGRYHLVMRAAEGGERGDGPAVVSLEDVRWNTPRTADRTLATMSVAELRRRLGQALGRAPLVG